MNLRALTSAGPGSGAALLILFAHLLLSGHCSLVAITSSRELLTALNTTSVDRIVLLQDVTLNGAEWRSATGFPLSIERNVTITGGLGPYLCPTLDLQYLTGRLALSSGVTVILEDLCLYGSVTQSGPGLEFAVLSLNATFLFRQVVIRRLVCLPVQDAYSNMRSLWRPDTLPGMQQVDMQENYCYNTTILQSQHCSLSVLYAADFAFIPSIRQGDVVSNGGFTVHYQDVHIVCDYSVDPKCLLQFPADFCVAQGLAERLAPNSKSHSNTLRIVLPVVLGGTFLILAAAGLFYWTRTSGSSTAGSVCCGKGCCSSATSIKASGTQDTGSVVSLSMAARTASNCTVNPVAHHFSTERVEELRRVLVAGSARPDVLDQIHVVERIGLGNFGKVYKGYWSGIPVAIKTLSFGGSSSSSSDQQQRMALMEAAISCSISHPNVVQTYTYSLATTSDGLGKRIKPAHSAPADSLFSSVGVNDYLLQTRAGPSQGNGGDGSLDSLEAPLGWEVRLVLEYCDQGSLREALDKGALRGGPGLGPKGPSPQSSAGSVPSSVVPPSAAESYGDQVDLLGLVDIGLDVCRGMVHLHSKNVVHSDLKARNILLKSAAPAVPSSREDVTSSSLMPDGQPAPLPPVASSMRLGVVAKVADFGLSLVIEPTATHISNIYQGTLTHMAPEVLIHGHLSKAADVYSFGILLWELMTGHHAFEGVPRALLAHRIGIENERPALPHNCPGSLAELIKECWHRDPAQRPSFDAVLKQLQTLRSDLSRGDESNQIWTYEPRTSNNSKAYETCPSSNFVDGMIAEQHSGNFLINHHSGANAMGTRVPPTPIQPQAAGQAPAPRPAGAAGPAELILELGPEVASPLPRSHSGGAGAAAARGRQNSGDSHPVREEVGAMRDLLVSSGSSGAGGSGSSEGGERFFTSLAATGPSSTVQDPEDVMMQQQLAAAHLILIGEPGPEHGFTVASPRQVLAPIPEMRSEEALALHSYDKGARGGRLRHNTYNSGPAAFVSSAPAHGPRGPPGILWKCEEPENL